MQIFNIEILLLGDNGKCALMYERREAKGRRCCLADRIDSIPFCASYFAEDDLKKEMNSSFSPCRPEEFILFYMSSCCNSTYSSESF